ncbi:transposase domain-containing protein [Buttiauxella sp.]|uniref:transposase domain-containing protein n=1 Tax=Buttiauxella sp. TaxID=1972222 RepID=UPI003C75179A
MELSQAPGIINVTTPEHARNPSEFIPSEFIQRALTLTDTVTLRKRQLPLESMICAASRRKTAWLLITLPWALPGKVPCELRTLYVKAKWLVLPGRRERSCPRELRVRSRKYPDKKAAGHLK